MTRRALYAGSFDPFTRGHADIVTRGLALFDEVIVAIGTNEAKRNLFSAEERFLCQGTSSTSRHLHGADRDPSTRA